MPALHINTNGSWRVVIKDLRSSQLDAVKEACMTITNAAGKVSKSPVSWKLTDAFGYGFAHLQYSCTDEGDATSEWKAR